MRRILLAFVCFAAVSFGSSGVTGDARAQTLEGTQPSQSGNIQLKIKPPEPGKWNVSRDPKRAHTVYSCKTLACPDLIRVTIAASRSPTQKPDPQALEKLAKVDLPKATRAANAAREIMSDGAETIETLLSETTSFHGYPAVVNETKYARGKAVVYKKITIIFAGLAMIRIEAVSPNQALAQKSLGEFIGGMEFQEGPPAPGKAKRDVI
jgi:hypothetical protein